MKDIGKILLKSNLFHNLMMSVVLLVAGILVTQILCKMLQKALERSRMEKAALPCRWM